MEERRSTLVPVVLAMLAFAFAVVPAYVGCYLWRGPAERLPDRGGETWMVLRQYPTRWECRLFAPAAKAEEQITGNSVLIWPPMKYHPE